MVRIQYKLDALCFKNLVVAPLLEEFIYRVCLINMFLEAKALTETEAVIYLPLFFSISHLHHIVVQRREPNFKFRTAFLLALFKLMYTQIFGIYSGFVYIRTGSIWPAFAIHSQCNFFGFPSFQSFFNRDFKLSDRLITGILYISGLIVFFIYFNSTFSNYTPWWIDSNSNNQ